MNLPSDIMKALDSAAGHLSGEVIAAYIDSALTSDEQQTVNRHLTACRACREQLDMVAEAVEADVGNPARIDALTERLAAIKPPGSIKPVHVVSNIRPERLGNRVRRVVDRTRDWIGSLETWSIRPAAAGVAMRAGSSLGSAGYAGVEASLEMLFAQEVLAEELGWAKGALSLTAAYDDAGRITDLRAAVGSGRSSEPASPIIVRVGPQGAAGVTLILTQDRPASVAAAPPLEGPLSDLTVFVSAGAVQ